MVEQYDVHRSLRIREAYRTSLHIPVPSHPVTSPKRPHSIISSDIYFHCRPLHHSQLPQLRQRNMGPRRLSWFLPRSWNQSRTRPSWDVYNLRGIRESRMVDADDRN